MICTVNLPEPLLLSLHPVQLLLRLFLCGRKRFQIRLLLTRDGFARCLQCPRDRCLVLAETADLVPHRFPVLFRPPTRQLHPRRIIRKMFLCKNILICRFLPASVLFKKRQLRLILPDQGSAAVQLLPALLRVFSCALSRSGCSGKCGVRSFQSSPRFLLRPEIMQMTADLKKSCRRAREFFLRLCIRLLRFPELRPESRSFLCNSLEIIRSLFQLCGICAQLLLLCLQNIRPCTQNLYLIIERNLVRDFEPCAFIYKVCPNRLHCFFIVLLLFQKNFCRRARERGFFHSLFFKGRHFL